ncbi:hypothetical protein [Virgibacillus sediminis]|uniref:Uncharacterized protein n=1 Tax=Virgibacillus sediminis TaxID=202260 RepID=A0ABV7AA25_9BACI
MAVASKLTSLGIIVFSVALGLLSYYLMNDQSEKQKKKHVEEVISQLVNFVIFIWLAKIILNVGVFITDPLVVLAYPASSNAFYLAVLLSALLLFYKAKRKQLDMRSFMETSLHTFLVASFVYEFFQLVWNGDEYAFGYVSVLAVLLAVYFLIHGRIGRDRLIIVMLTGWTAGILILSTLQPFVAVFGYMVEVWFILLFYMISLGLHIFYQRKRGYNGN